MRRALGLVTRMFRSNAAIYLGAAVLCRGVSFLLIPLYTHRLSVTEYGDFALGQSAVTLLSMAMTLGTVSAVPRAFFREKTPEQGLRAAGNVGAWMVVIAVTAAVLLELGVLAFVPAASSSILGRFEWSCIVVASLGTSFTTVPSLLARAAQRPYVYGLLQLLEAVSVASFSIYFVVVSGLGVRGALLGLACAYTCNAVVALLVILAYLGGRVGRTPLGDLLKFSLPFVPHHAANWAQSAADRWILKGAGFDETVGPFSIANTVLSPANMTVLAFNDHAAARMGESFRGAGLEGLHATLRKIRPQYLFSALVPSLVCLLALPVLPHILGRSFTTAFWTIPILVLINLVDTQYYPHLCVLYYGERTNLIPRATVLGAAANVVLNLVLVPRLGLPGALLARASTVLLRTAAMVAFARTVLGAKPKSSTI